MLSSRLWGSEAVAASNRDSAETLEMERIGEELKWSRNFMRRALPGGSMLVYVELGGETG